MKPLLLKNATACRGLKAPNTCGDLAIHIRPSPLITTNHTMTTGPNNTADSMGAKPLDSKQADQDDDRDRHDVGRQHRRRDFKALDGAEHRDRRRDHAVAVEQRRAEDAQQDQGRPARRETRTRLRRRGATAGDQCRQREDAAFALVVGPQHERDILQRHDEQQRVNDERQHAQDVVVADGHRVRSEKALANRIERAGADVAKHYAEGGERERNQSAGMVRAN